MTRIENYLSLARRQGFKKVPVELEMSPHIKAQFDTYCNANEINLETLFATKNIVNPEPKEFDKDVYNKFYSVDFKLGTTIDSMGVAHEPGSDAAFHMTKMYNPMAKFDSTSQILEYPFLDFSSIDLAPMKQSVKKIHNNDQIAIGSVQITIWESAWYLRGMENLMMDMMAEDEMAEILFNKITDIAIQKVTAFANAGADAIFVGDDIGMQHSIMMSEDLYCTWIKPRLKKVIDAARLQNPNLIIFYHSCGYVTPFIPHLIETGIDVLNPIQPECMNFSEIHKMYGDKLSFHGTIGTQTTMPYGTPDDVRREVFANLDIAGDKGGLFVTPTHVLEPDVPLENIIAYLKACKDYK